MATGNRALWTALVGAAALWSLSGVCAVTDDMLKIACGDMTPRHPGYKPENTSPSATNPYQLLVDPPTVTPGSLVNVTLIPAHGTTPQYKGFMIQARDEDGHVLGIFLPECGANNDSAYHMITCPNGVQRYNTVVQSNNKFKTHETFTWVAPVSLKRPFIFKYTVVLDFEHFWTNEKTPEIQVTPLSAEEYKIKSSIYQDYYIYKLYIQKCFS